MTGTHFFKVMIPKSICIDCSQKCPRKKTKSNENLHNGHLNTSSALCFPLSHYFLFVDKNECLNNKGHCSQYCFNERGSYRCGCRIGYTLEKDGRYCKGTDFFMEAGTSWNEPEWEKNRLTLKNYGINNSNLHAKY